MNLNFSDAKQASGASGSTGPFQNAENETFVQDIHGVTSVEQESQEVTQYHEPEEPTVLLGLLEYLSNYLLPENYPNSHLEGIRNNLNSRWECLRLWTQMYSENYINEKVMELGLNQSDRIRLSSLLRHEFDNIFRKIMEELNVFIRGLSSEKYYMDLCANQSLLFRTQIATIINDLFIALNGFSKFSDIIEQLQYNIKNHQFDMRMLCIDICEFSEGITIETEGKIPENLKFVVNEVLGSAALREALRNSHKHHATKVTIKLLHDNKSNSLLVKIIDNGSGIATNKSATVKPNPMIKSTANSRSGMTYISSMNGVSMKELRNNLTPESGATLVLSFQIANFLRGYKKTLFKKDLRFAES
jgi:hypothetical protein